MSDQVERRALAGRRDPMPRELLLAVGEALYGPAWVSPLASALGVNRVTVAKWKAGKARVTPMIARELLAMCEARQKTLMALGSELKTLDAS